MSATPLAVEIVCVFCVAVGLLHKFGDWRRQHFMVTLATLVAWYFSFIIIFVLPLDVSSTFYRQCLKDSPSINTVTVSTAISENFSSENINASPSFPSLHSARQNVNTECKEPWSNVNHILPDLWRVVYWTSMVLTWLVIPIMMSYSAAGDFTVLGKLRTAMIENAIWYGSYLLIFGVLLIYVAAKPDLNLDTTGLMVILVTASNTWGLFLVVLMLGYGLVEVPRNLWYSSKRGYMLNRIWFKLAKLSLEKSEAEEALEDVLEDVRKVTESIREHHPLHKNVQTILSKCPDDMQKRLRSVNNGTAQPMEVPNEKSLARLHKRTIIAVRNHHRTQCQWNLSVERAFHLEDVEKNSSSNEHYFKHTFMPERNSCVRAVYTPTLEWYWQCLLRPWVMRILAVFLAVFAISITWSEVTFFNKSPVLSIFAQFIHLAARSYNYFQIEIISCATIAFLAVCTYYTVFKVRVLNYYYLAPFHQTDEYSLLFSGMFLCRLTPALCLNFLGLIHLDTHITGTADKVETSYTKIMGHMDIISDGFNIYFPIMIVVLCIATYFHVGSRCLHFLGFEQFLGDDDITQEIVDEGREHVKREKRRRQRNEHSESRRRDVLERSGAPRSTSLHSIGSGSDTRQRDVSSTGGNKKAAGITPSSSSENDHTQLLKDVEPIDYMGQNADLYSEFNKEPSSINSSYQSRNFPTAGAQSSRPVRGIFDDV